MEQTEATAIERTYLYLDNYNEMQRYIKEAVSEATQVEETDVYNISAERAFLKSIRECRTETIILFEHINKSLDALRKEAEAAGEGCHTRISESVIAAGRMHRKHGARQWRNGWRLSYSEQKQ